MNKLLALLISGLLVTGVYAETKKEEKNDKKPVAEKKAEADKKVEADKKEEKKNIGPRNRQTKKEQEKGDTARLDAKKEEAKK